MTLPINLDKPYTMVSGTTANSADVNADFDYVVTALNTTNTTVNQFYNTRYLLGTVVNVMDYGAVNDGVTDNLAVVQALLDDSDITSIYLPGGTYLFSDMLTVNSNTRLFGEGTIKAGTLPADSAGEIHFPLLLGTAVTSVVIDGLTFDISNWSALPSGASSLRCVSFRSSSDIQVNNCNFTTTGGAVCFLGCNSFDVTGNTITNSAMVAGDGAIDIWCENSNDAYNFTVKNNIIKGAGFARWGILCNGVDYLGDLMTVHDFSMSGNIIDNCDFDGIWIGGRKPTAYNFAISNNVIANCRKGITLSDCNIATVESNIINNMTSYGIELWNESASGGVIGITNSIIASNSINTIGTSGGTPPAIFLSYASGTTVSGNVVSGTTHYYGVYASSNASGNYIYGNLITKGIGANVLQQSVTNKLDCGTYSPTLTGATNIASVGTSNAKFNCHGEFVTVYFRVYVTPTATGATAFYMSLPIASNLITYSLFGSCSGLFYEAGRCTEDATGDRATITFNAANTSETQLMGSFTYQILY